MLRLADLFPDPHDRELIELMAEGEPEFARYVRVLGVDHLDTVEQRRRVKQAKDRVRLRLKRFGVRLHA